MNAPATIAAPYDVEAVRRDFPILARTVYDRPLVYLDNAASAQKPKAMIDAVTAAYGSEYANVHRGLHFLSNMATEKYEEAREIVRRFVNAEHPDEIIFTRNATEAINLVAASFGAMAIGEGDEIVLSILEHHSNIVPWHFHRERNGAVIKWAPIADDGTFLLDEFEKLLTDRTKIVAVTQMSNVTGTVVPIKEICRIAHARGIPVLVDGSQGAVHLPVDVRDLDCDFYCFTGHKLYGPTGIGVLYGKREHLRAMPPYHGRRRDDRRGDGGRDHLCRSAAPLRGRHAADRPGDRARRRARPIWRASAASRSRRTRRTFATTRMERLSRINSLTLYGTTKDKGAIVSFNMAGAHPHDVSTIIDRAGVAVRAGTHCAQPLLARYGTTATCRASFAHVQHPRRGRRPCRGAAESP